MLDRTLEKCERENGFIYHQKVPYDPVELPLNAATHGLVAPEVMMAFQCVSNSASDWSGLGDTRSVTTLDSDGLRCL